MARFTKETAALAGKKSAANLSPQQLVLRASALGNSTLKRYGTDYYAKIRYNACKRVSNPQSLVQLLLYYGWEPKGVTRPVGVERIWVHRRLGSVWLLTNRERHHLTAAGKPVFICRSLKQFKAYVIRLCNEEKENAA